MVGGGEQGAESAREMPRWDSGSSQKRPGLCLTTASRQGDCYCLLAKGFNLQGNPA